MMHKAPIQVRMPVGIVKPPKSCAKPARWATMTGACIKAANPCGPGPPKAPNKIALPWNKKARPLAIRTMFTTYLFLASARKVLNRIGPKGIDAATRIIGFFVSAMGMGLIFDGVTEALQTYGIATGR